MMSVTLPLARLRLRVLPHSRRGFSLVELLAVVGILAIIAILGGGEISRAWKRQKVQSASTDIKVLFQRALPEMQRRNMRTFIQVGPMVPLGANPGHVPLYLIGDADQDGVLGVFLGDPTCRTIGCPDLLIAEYDIKALPGEREFSLSVDDVTKIQSNLWLPPAPCGVLKAPFCDDDDWTVSRALMCDFQGRAIDTTNGRQIAGPAMLVLTHVSVVSGALAPPTRYVININPVWSVRVEKQIKDATSTWVTQNG